MNECSAYVGLDVHKDTIAVAVALSGRGEAVYQGEINNQRKSLLWLIRALSPNGEVVSFCDEAGSCGYGVYREIVETGHRCEVVAPGLVPRRWGERVKTDRRDALKGRWRVRESVTGTRACGCPAPGRMPRMSLSIRLYPRTRYASRRPSRLDKRVSWNARPSPGSPL